MSVRMGKKFLNELLLQILARLVKAHQEKTRDQSSRCFQRTSPRSGFKTAQKTVETQLALPITTGARVFNALQY